MEEHFVIENDSGSDPSQFAVRTDFRLEEALAHGILADGFEDGFDFSQLDISFPQVRRQLEGCGSEEKEGMIS